jgi:L-ascorbate metabolism protein UlaG (beta-lactamase superfamily)
MIKPFLSNDAFLADVDAAPRDPSVFHLWWLGQSGYLLRWRDEAVLLDPYLSDSLTRKYAGTDKPHVRMTEQVINPARLGFVGWATASHQHTDHLDPDTLQALRAANPALRLVFPEAHRALAAQRSGLPDAQLHGLDAGGRLTLGAFEIEAVRAAHENLDTDPAGQMLYLGFFLRFGPFTLYHSGDTVRFAGMERALAGARPSVALLPINGRAPERRVAGNLTGREAAQLAHDIGAAVVIPGHYEMFEFNTASPADFTHECNQLGQRYAVLRAGERWTGGVR